MNNMNFRLQAGCQHCGNCSCRSQKPNNTVPECNSHSQNQSNMASGCNNHHQNQPRTCDSGCERPHYRPPENCADSISHIDMHNIPIGIGYVPWQKWRNVYALCEGLSQGTILFPAQSIPLILQRLPVLQPRKAVFQMDFAVKKEVRDEQRKA